MRKPLEIHSGLRSAPADRGLAGGGEHSTRVLRRLPFSPSSYIPVHSQSGTVNQCCSAAVHDGSAQVGRLLRLQCWKARPTYV